MAGAGTRTGGLPSIGQAAFLLACWLAGTPAALAAPSEGEAPTWREVKCARYREAWSQALARRGPGGLGADFLLRHEAFLASGCTGPADVCPRSDEELALANLLVISAMNAGTASTFPPFACRR